MIERVAIIDSEVLSELSRGHPRVTELTRQYLEAHGRLTISAVSVFERLRGYRAALHLGKPFQNHLHHFHAFVRCCIVLPVDARVADTAATIWAALSTRKRKHLGDILIAATACANALAIVTRNAKHFAPMVASSGTHVPLLNWTKPR
jgi:predicted nucleic acid-binding protein